MNDPKQGDLVISETSTGMYNYHLRVIGPEGPKYSGAPPPALCGRKLGWDTRAPLESWNHKNHIPATYCSVCDGIARKLGFHLKVLS